MLLTFVILTNACQTQYYKLVVMLCVTNGSLILLVDVFLFYVGWMEDNTFVESEVVVEGKRGGGWWWSYLRVQKLICSFCADVFLSHGGIFLFLCACYYSLWSVCNCNSIWGTISALWYAFLTVIYNRTFR